MINKIVPANGICPECGSADSGFKLIKVKLQN